MAKSLWAVAKIIKVWRDLNLAIGDVFPPQILDAAPYLYYASSETKATSSACPHHKYLYHCRNCRGPYKKSVYRLMERRYHWADLVAHVHSAMLAGLVQMKTRWFSSVLWQGELLASCPDVSGSFKYVYHDQVNKFLPTWFAALLGVNDATTGRKFCMFSYQFITKLSWSPYTVRMYTAEL